MKKYVKQFDDFSCGPIAIINVLKFLGMPTNLKQLTKYKKACKTTSYHGTFEDDLNEALHRLIGKYAKVNQLEKKKFTTTRKMLRKGCCAVFLCPTYEGYHIELLFQKDRYTLFEINNGMGLPKIMEMSYEELKHLLTLDSEIWIIEPKKS